ncbi:MAG: endonuclease/exonuclease/phosphatase family protein [Treponema sp.]|nr:endonuclease/exonuclease/phosphatase family protein [Treponema sp.]
MIIILIGAGFVLLTLLFAGGGLLWLNANEYKPGDWEPVQVFSSPPHGPARHQSLELYSWNIGYASLDAGADFFMDGGKGVRPSSEKNVEENIWAIQALISASAADIIFLQEVDVNSKRSYNINQAAYFSEAWKGSSAFALNYRCLFVPVPFPRFIGKVESGLLTLNSYGGSAERISLPSPFSWPERLAQLKRCLLVERIPVQEHPGSGTGNTELVLINLHLEAYDTGGTGRTAQTRALAEFLKTEYEKGNYCVAGGDFNQVFPDLKEAFPIRRQNNFAPTVVDDSLFGKDWILAADPSAPSCRSIGKPYNGREEHQLYIIDGFILSPNVKLISVQTLDLDFKNSDHNPVKLTFSLK